MYEDIVKRHRPRGWRIVYSRRKDRIAAERAELYSRSRLPKVMPPLAEAAAANPIKRVFYAPHVVDEFTLHTVLHEFAHVHLKHWDSGQSVQHKEEFEAEQWACAIMKMEGVPVTKALRRSMRRYVKSCVSSDESHGEPIWPHIRRFAEAGASAETA